MEEASEARFWAAAPSIAAGCEKLAAFQVEIGKRTLPVDGRRLAVLQRKVTNHRLTDRGRAGLLDHVHLPEDLPLLVLRDTKEPRAIWHNLC